MTPEGNLKKALKKLLTDCGAFWSMIPEGPYAKTGDPDMVACYKGHYIAIEAKTPTGVQSDWQKLRQEQIESAGGIYILARKVMDVKTVLEHLDSKDE